jgi:hypothetical protein
LPEAELSQKSLKQLRGHLPWPLADVRLLSHYDSLKGDGAQRWDGVILKAEEGAEVRAVQSGRVVYADWLRGFGLLIIIEHDDDYMTLYGHNQAPRGARRLGCRRRHDRTERQQWWRCILGTLFCHPPPWSTPEPRAMVQG